MLEIIILQGSVRGAGSVRTQELGSRRRRV